MNSRVWKYFSAFIFHILSNFPHFSAFIFRILTKSDPVLLYKMAQLAVRCDHGGFDLGVLGRDMGGLGVFSAASTSALSDCVFARRLQETRVCVGEGDGVGTDGLSPMSGLSGRSR